MIGGISFLLSSCSLYYSYLEKLFLYLSILIFDVSNSKNTFYTNCRKIKNLEDAMKKYYKYKIRFLLNLFIVFITINKSVFAADRKSPFVINNVIEEDSKCINKCDEKS